MAECPNKEKNAEDCACKYVFPACGRLGICCDCIRFHRTMGEIPECLKEVVEEMIKKGRVVCPSQPDTD